MKASALEVAEAQREAERNEQWALVEFWGDILQERLEKLNELTRDSDTAAGTDS